MDKLTTPTREAYPQIYVFEDKHDPGWLKAGETTRKNAEDRVRQQFNTKVYKLVLVN